MQQRHRTDLSERGHSTGTLWHFVLVKAGSLWLGSLLMMLTLIVLSFATAYESAHGTPAALEHYYESWWFQGLLTILSLNILAAIALRWRRIRRKMGFFATHFGVIVILVGGLITLQWGVRGQMTIVEGEKADSFLIEDTAALVARFDHGAPAVRDITDWIEGGAKKGEEGPSLTHGDLTLRAREYYPDSIWTNRLTPGDGDSPSAVAVVMKDSDGAEEDDVIFEGRSAILLDKVISYRRIGREEDLKRMLSVNKTNEVTRVTVEVHGEKAEIPVSGNIGRDVTIGNTGMVAHIALYFPHASVGSSKKIVNLSDRPANPYAEVLIRPQGTPLEKATRHRSFARFPEFGNMHRESRPDNARVTLLAPMADHAVTPIEVLVGPDGSAYVRFAPQESPFPSSPLVPGRSTATPWKNVTLTLVEFREHARLDRILRPVPAPRREPQPGIIVEVSDKTETRLLGLRQFDHGTIAMGSTQIDLTFSAMVKKLDFAVGLKDFHIEHYPGTGRPRAFISEVTFRAGEDSKGREASISMNRPADFGGYTFFQSSYRTIDGKDATVLSLGRDPGQWVVFAGYIITLLGMLMVFFKRAAEGQHGELPEPSHEAMTPDDSSRNAETPGASLAARATLVMTLLLALGARPAEAQIPQDLDYDLVRDIVVQHDGRWPPLDTVARDIIWSVTGDQEFMDVDPVGMLLGWTFNPPKWMETPLIKISNADLRREFGLDSEKTRYSFLDLIDHKTLRPLMQRAATLEGRKPDALEEKALDLRSKLLTLQKVWGGHVLRIIPNAHDPQGAWTSIPRDVTARGPGIAAAGGALDQLWQSYLDGNAEAFAKAAGALKSSLRGLPGAHPVDAKQITAELRYNRLKPFRMAAWALSAGWLFSLLSVFLKRRWLDLVALLVIFVGFALTTWGLSLRWTIAGRIPAANMYESLLFLAWGTALFAVVATLVQKQRLVPFTASFMAALTMLLCNVLPMDGFVRPIAPVLLGTVWMSIHVPIIMVSYSVLALAVFVAHLQLVTMAFMPEKHKLIRRFDVMHYWYVHLGTILLTLGIMTGSMWAASSWGRYWGWDPKEVWSLVALLGYMVIIHMRGDRGHTTPRMVEAGGALSLAVLGLVFASWGSLDMPLAVGLLGSVVALLVFLLVRGVFATAVKSIACFWLVIMTYLGVNYVLGTGMHSYGFGKGAVVRHATNMAVGELLLIALCSAVVLWRRKRNPASSPVPGISGSAS